MHGMASVSCQNCNARRPAICTKWHPVELKSNADSNTFGVDIAPWCNSGFDRYAGPIYTKKKMEYCQADDISRLQLTVKHGFGVLSIHPSTASPGSVACIRAITVPLLASMPGISSSHSCRFLTSSTGPFTPPVSSGSDSGQHFRCTVFKDWRDPQWIDWVTARGQRTLYV